MNDRALRDEIESQAAALKHAKRHLEGLDLELRALHHRREEALESQASSRRLLEEANGQLVMLRSSLSDARLRIAELEARTKRPGFFARLLDVFR